MRQVHPVLVVANSEAPEPADMGLGHHATLLAGEVHALAIIGERPLAGLVIIADGSGPLRASRELVTAFLRRQPCGRVAVLSRTACSTISTQLAFMPDRVDVFFEPWEPHAISNFLGIASGVAAAV